MHDNATANFPWNHLPKVADPLEDNKLDDKEFIFAVIWALVDPPGEFAPADSIVTGALPL